MRGAASPRAAGTMRVPREKSRRARASISAWAAAKKGAPKPRATDPATTARGRSRRLAVEEAAVEDDPAADAGGHDHGDEMGPARRGPHPAFAPGQGLGVVVDEGGQAGGLRHPAPQREPAPGRDVESGHLLAA